MSTWKALLLLTLLILGAWRISDEIRRAGDSMRMRVEAETAEMRRVLDR